MGLRFPCKINLSLCVINTLSLSNVAVHPWSQSCPTEMRDVARSGNRCTVWASGGKSIWSLPSCELVIFCPLDTVTRIGLVVGCTSKIGVFLSKHKYPSVVFVFASSSFQKCPVVPESIIGLSSRAFDVRALYVGGEGATG